MAIVETPEKGKALQQGITVGVTMEGYEEITEQLKNIKRQVEEIYTRVDGLKHLLGVKD